MDWFEDWPTECGWYWLRWENGRGMMSFPIVVWVKKVEPDNHLTIDGLHPEHLDDRHGPFAWYGPVDPPPTPPEWECVEDEEEDG